MSYVEEELTAALRERAGAEVDPRALLAGSLARGRARVRRRQVFTAAGMAGTTAAVLVAVSLAVGGIEAPPAGERSGQYAVPAVASDLPGAEQSPESVATDPFTLHFGVAALPLPVDVAIWESQIGVESLALDVNGSDGGKGQLWFQLARRPIPPDDGNVFTPSVTTTPTTVNGRAATLEARRFPDRVAWGLRWEQVNGVQARLDSSGLSKADTMAVAEALRFDRSSRCSVPLRLTDVPSGSAVVGCRLAYGQPRPPAARTTTPHASLRVASGGSAVSVGTFPAVVSPDSHEPQPEVTRLPNGITAGWLSDRELFFQSGPLDVSVTAHKTYGRAEVATVAEGLSLAGDPSNPETWPADPLA